jgi:predicted permease
LRRLFAKLRSFFGRERAEKEMVREIASHLALLEDEFLRRGMDLPRARLAAKRAYGGVEQAKELHRDARSLFWLEQMLQDLRHAWRSLSKSPGFAAVALLSLAFGIGVNTAIFTLVNGILLKKLPVPDPDRIVQLTVHIDKENFNGDGFNFLSYRELRRQTSIFADVIAFWGISVALDAGGEPNKIRLEMVTGSYFPFLAAKPALGRLLDEEDDRLEGANRVCVLSYRLWQSHFGGDPGVLNRTVRLDNVPLQVAGVAAPNFVGAELQERPDLWVATALTPNLAGHPRDSANYIWLRVLARLRPGISFREARDRLAAASPSIENALPKERANAGAVYRIHDASHGFDAWRTELRDPLLILMGAVSLVLLVACANLANLLLARTNERQHEFAIKLSLGISRWRLLRQLLVETFLLVFSGGVVAYFLSVALTRFLLVLFNEGKQYAGLHLAPDASVVLYAFSACILTAVVAGLYPAWQASCTDSSPGLKGAALHGNRRRLVRRSLIVVQVALAVVLLFGASLFTHSLRKLKTVNLGYDIDRLLAVDISERRGSQTGLTLPHLAFADILARVRGLPAVESAALSNPEILSDMKMSGDLTSNETSRKASEVIVMIVSPGYFRTMHMPLFAGRDFAKLDRKGSPPVAVINRRLASLLSPNQEPVGTHFDGWGNKNVEVIGVTGNSKYLNVREDTRPIAYFAFDQEAPEWGVLQIRCRGSVAATEREVREIIKTAAPGLEVFRATAMELVRDNSIAQERLLAFLSSLFGTLGTALALVGIYGLISYSVTRRTREIGIRMSIGAQRGDVLWLFLRESTLLVAGGMLIGLPLALVLAGFVRKMLFEVSTSDPLGISVTLALLLLGGLLASFVPARRATRVNPAQALRYD